ncbi:orotidine 5'-phosphate decarboxylase [[Clostridium] innocuum]|nr:orotidine 5'-phosphate decarboxylase [[Clostridium] innocuum]
MKLQIATDIANTETVFSIADAVHDVIDILEVGTPVITKEGLVPVYHVKLRYPNLCVCLPIQISLMAKLWNVRMPVKLMRIS